MLFFLGDISVVFFPFLRSLIKLHIPPLYSFYFPLLFLHGRRFAFLYLPCFRPQSCCVFNLSSIHCLHTISTFDFSTRQFDWLAHLFFISFLTFARSEFRARLAFCCFSDSSNVCFFVFFFLFIDFKNSFPLISLKDKFLAIHRPFHLFIHQQNLHSLYHLFRLLYYLVFCLFLHQSSLVRQLIIKNFLS